MTNVIFGAGQRAREIKYLLKLENIDIDYFIVDKKYLSASVFDDTTVISTEVFLEKFQPNQVKLYLGIGMPKMNMVREKIFSKFHSYGFVFEKYISPMANILTNSIGEGTTIFAGVNIGPNVTIGAGNHFEMGVTVSHDCVIGDYNFFAPGCTFCGDVVIGNGNFFGSNCTVKNSIQIGNYVLVGAAAYADKDLFDYSVLLPSRSIVLEDKDSIYFINK